MVDVVDRINFRTERAREESVCVRERMRERERLQKTPHSNFIVNYLRLKFLGN